MKKLIPIFLISLSGCSNPHQQQEEMIKDFVETDHEVRTDLSFSLVDLKLDSVITVFDSVKIAYYHELNSGETLKDDLNSDITREKYFQKTVRGGNESDAYKEAAIEKSLERQAIRDRFLKLLEDSGRVIGNVYTAKYKIVNPALNNAKQEVTRKYVFSADNKRILGTLK